MDISAGLMIVAGVLFVPAALFIAQKLNKPKDPE